MSRTVVITGASSGIGFALAESYLSAGFNVVGNGRSQERLHDAAEKLGNPDNFLAVAETSLLPTRRGVFLAKRFIASERSISS